MKTGFGENTIEDPSELFYYKQAYTYLYPAFYIRFSRDI